MSGSTTSSLPASAFADQRAWLERYRAVLLAESQPITGDNVLLVEHLLLEAEVDAARGALSRAGPPAFAPGPQWFVRQEGTTCMSTSLANGMLSFGEPFLAADPEGRVPLLVLDVVARTSSLGKPGDYRSVDDLFKYLEAGHLGALRAGEERFAADYALRLTCSLLDVCEGLWTGRARLIVQRAAHAYLGFALAERGGEPVVLVRDPLSPPGRGHVEVGLEELRQEYLWSPLKKIPRLMGPLGFPSLDGAELQGHLDRYAAMHDLGVECPSALLYRRADAPPLREGGYT